MDTRKIKCFTLSREHIMLALQGRMFWLDGLPDDIKVLRIGAYDALYDGFDVIVTSETFPEVPNGVMPERIGIFYWITAQPLTREIIETAMEIVEKSQEVTA